MNIVNNSTVSLVDSMGSDLSVVNAARVSFAKESDWEETPFVDHNKEPIKELSAKDQKLIKYLAEHGHWSPFAHTSLTFRIKAPIFVARQLVKHQVGGVWNEVSRRYVDDEPEFYFPLVWRRKAENVKQGSSNTRCEYMYIEQWDGSEGIYGSDQATPENMLYRHTNDALRWYQDIVRNGVAPEQARMVLPQNTMTEWWWTGSLMFFARVCKQRLDAHAQQETREVAEQIDKLIPDVFKHSWEYLRKTN